MGGEDPRGGGRAAPGAPPLQARDPGALRESGALRQPDRGRRTRGASLLRPPIRHADAGRGRVSRRAAAAADALQPVARCVGCARAAVADSRPHARAGLALRPGCHGRKNRAPVTPPRSRVGRRAPLRGTGPGGRGHLGARPNRHHARRQPAARHPGHHRGAAPGTHRAPCRQRRGGRARQPHRRLAGLGRIGQLLRRRARRRDRRRDHAAPARLGAEAVHVRRGIRARHASGPRTGGRARAIPHGGAGHSVQPAQLRQPVPRPAARARGAGRIRKRARRRPRLGHWRTRRPADPPPGGIHHAHRHRGALRPGPHARQRGGAPRGSGHGLRRVGARRPERAAGDDTASRRSAGRRARGRAHPRRAHGFLGHGHPGRRRSARLHLRARRQPRIPVHGGGENRNIAGVPRQLGGGLHARRDGRRVGRQLRSHDARRIHRCHGRRPDLPRRDAGRGRTRARRTADRRPLADPRPDHRCPPRRGLRAVGPRAHRGLPASHDGMAARRHGAAGLRLARHDAGRCRHNLA